MQLDPQHKPPYSKVHEGTPVVINSHLWTLKCESNTGHCGPYIPEDTFQAH